MSTEEISWFGKMRYYITVSCLNGMKTFIIGISLKVKSPIFLNTEKSDYFLSDTFAASLMTFATIPTCLVGGFLGEYLGRRMTCFLVSPLFLTSFLCTALAQVITELAVTESVKS